MLVNGVDARNWETPDMVESEQGQVWQSGPAPAAGHLASPAEHGGARQGEAGGSTAPGRAGEDERAKVDDDEKKRARLPALDL